MRRNITELLNRTGSIKPDPTGDTLRVETDDGANIALRHYRPEPGARFNNRNQPIIMIPGAMVNFSYFDIHTPEGKKCRTSLPENLPDWADNDERILKDPMKLYNMPYYLYSRGYDVWLVNYGDQGRGIYKSHRKGASDTEHYAIYDVKAAVKKVRELTGKRPVHVGHSLGATMALVYLQGTYHVPGSNLKVDSDPRLVEERNAGTGPEAIKGLVCLDGPVVPLLFGNFRGPLRKMIWYATGLHLYYSFRIVTKLLPIEIGKIAKWLFSLVWKFKPLTPSFFKEAFAIAYSVNPGNIEADVFGHIGKNAADGGTAHLIGQWVDSSQIGKLRESYRGGKRSDLKFFPPQDSSDGLYYFSDNMDKVSLPSVFLADATVDVTKPDDIRNTYDMKTRHPIDEFHVMPDTAHLDLTCGIRAPYETFPKIDAWIRKLGSD